ncbi:hypothetical protein J5N97_016988 [Dioscorea zingiberensis]|uniref:Aquaporin n=1 Tax=Dioscorea zingiberensis TaxID=325984 RepID=A0A9D5CMD4_9LILI|nr:hypothetical protein J5N97_016988 [Dioscorea zingiberensis]
MAPRDPLAALEAGKRVAEDLAGELVGTYILILIGVGSILVDQRVKITLLGVALVWGTAVTVLFYTLGHISGCHLNPAVTIAFFAIGQFPWKLVVPYVVVQVLGATIASLTLRLLFIGVDADLMQSHPAGTTTTDAMAVKELAGVAVGAAVFFNGLIAGTISGASMNPARSLGPAIATMNFEEIWIYIVSPVIGAVAGSTLYHFLRLPNSMFN